MTHIPAQKFLASDLLDFPAATFEQDDAGAARPTPFANGITVLPEQDERCGFD